MPSQTQNNFMDLMRQMTFRGPVHWQDPAPEPDNTVEIPVGPDYNQYLFENVSINSVQSQHFRLPTDEEREAIQRIESVYPHLIASQQDVIYWQRIAEQFQRGEHRLGRDQNPWTMYSETIEPADEFYELPNLNHRGIKEAGVRYKGVECTVLPVISLKSGQVEYCKGSPEPANGTERLEFEKYAMEKIIEWGKKNTQAFK